MQTTKFQDTPLTQSVLRWMVPHENTNSSAQLVVSAQFAATLERQIMVLKNEAKTAAPKVDKMFLVLSRQVTRNYQAVKTEQFFIAKDSVASIEPYGEVMGQLGNTVITLKTGREVFAFEKVEDVLRQYE